MFEDDGIFDRKCNKCKTINEERKVEIKVFILCYQLKRLFGTQLVLMVNVTKVIVV